MGRDLTGVIDAVIAGILVLDAEGRVELVNSAACEFLEISAEATWNEPIEELFGASHPIPQMVRKVIRSGGTASENELQIKRRLDDDLLIDVAVSPLLDDDGPPTGAVVVLRDRTLQKSLEKLVEDRESIRAFGSIAAGIAHEVKNPLGGIRGAAELLAERTEEPRTKEIAEVIVREVKRIAALVDELMVFTPGDAIDLAPMNVHRVLDEVLEIGVLDPISSAVEIERWYDPSIPEMLGDADRLAQVFLNIARNSFQAMAESGGKLVVRTRMPLDHRLSSQSGAQIPTLLIEFRDDGPGISPEALAKLATPFFTTRPDGTGLGLAVSRNWIARHGGAMQIGSTEGEGTSVRVSLPLRKCE